MKTHINSFYVFAKKYLKTQIKWIFLLGIIMISNTGLQIIAPRILRQVIDGIIGESTVEQILYLLSGFLILILMGEFLKLVISYVSNKIGWNAAGKLRRDLLECCLGQKEEVSSECKEGELIEIINGDVQILFNFFSLVLVSLFQAVLLVAGTLIAVAAQNKMMGVIETVFLIFVFWVFGKIHNFAVPSWKKDREHASDFYGYLGECIKAKEDLKANGAVPYIQNQLYKTLKNWFPDYKKAHVKGYTSYAVYIFIVSLSYAIVFGLGAYLWLKGLVTVGTVYLLYQYNQNLIQPIEALRRQMDELQKISASMERIQTLLSQPLEENDGENLDGAKGIEIRVQNLNFSYNNAVLVLKNVSFTLKKNEILGVIGRTGSGKTTLVKLLVRMYAAEEGVILIDGIPIEKLSLKSLREHISYVTQDVQIFDASLRDNITFFDHRINDDHLIGLMNDLGLKNWFDTLEDGLDTRINAHKLSLGQAQLVALIRAFLKDARLIILDEAYSNLDPSTEMYLQKVIDRLFLNRTGIIITHRLQTLKRADRVMLIKDGCVSEEGRYSETAEDETSIITKLLEQNRREVLI